ncbi:MAG: MBL fold metallo-hydrolase [Planctomycetota bacterium]|nr:MBL fold metallo-hydrolase [Planctomycetota bacterium]
MSNPAPSRGPQESAWSPTSLEVGEWKITALFDANFRLDGGAMWGVVPKNLWARLTPPAEDNTIRLAARPFLAEKDGVKVIVEGGMGDRWDDKFRKIYGLDRPEATTLRATLAAVDVGPEDIDHVVVSHCHFDHIGALVELQGGSLEPLFSRARHHFPTAEVGAARVPMHPRRASYRADDIDPLVERGLVEMHDGGHRLFEDLELVPVRGHSEGMVVIRFNAAGDGLSAAFWGDLIPTTHHIQPPYIMAYDMDVSQSFSMRTEWLAKAADEGIVGLSYHDPDRAFTRLERDGKRYVAVDVPELGLRG